MDFTLQTTGTICLLQNLTTLQTLPKFALSGKNKGVDTLHVDIMDEISGYMIWINT